MSYVLKKTIWLFVILPAGVVLVALALANRHTVRLVLDPLTPDNPVLSIEAPFFLFLFGSAIVGLLMGGAATWLGQGRWRRTARQRSQEATELRREADRLNQQLETAAQPRLPRTAPAD